MNLFWVGDQNVDWGVNDGIKSVGECYYEDLLRRGRCLIFTSNTHGPHGLLRI